MVANTNRNEACELLLAALEATDDGGAWSKMIAEEVKCQLDILASEDGPCDHAFLVGLKGRKPAYPPTVANASERAQQVQLKF